MIDMGTKEDLDRFVDLYGIDTICHVLENHVIGKIETVKESKVKESKVKENELLHSVIKRNRGYCDRDMIISKRDSLKFWTHELIEWIGKENDPVKLAVASCLVNCQEYPKWLPGKPKESKDRDYLFYVVEVHEMLKEKSEKIAPKLYTYIWLTQYFRSYVL